MPAALICGIPNGHEWMVVHSNLYRRPKKPLGRKSAEAFNTERTRILENVEACTSQIGNLWTAIYLQLLNNGVYVVPHFEHLQ